MSWPFVRTGRLAALTVVLCAPSALAIGGLAIAAGAHLVTALAAALVGVGGLAALLWLVLPDVCAVAGFARALDEDPAARPPLLLRPALVPGLAEAVTRLDRGRGSAGSGEALAAAAGAILDHLPDPLIMIDRLRRVLRTNRAADALVGKKVQNADLAYFIRNPVLLEAVDAVLAGAPEREVEFTALLPVERTFAARAVRLPDATGDGVVAVVALYELTGQKRTEQMRVDFIANASHELRTPLSVLVAALETVRGPARDDPEGRDRFLAMMAQQSERMTRLVADLLSLSRIELNENLLPAGQVGIPGVVGRALDTLRMPAAARGIKIENALPADFPPVRGDEDELIQVFVNLVDNALKYGRPNGTVRIRPRPLARENAHLVGHPGPVVGIAVSDEGEGIAEEHLPRLTERFYRVDTARSREAGGTGLGLAIVKHIMNRHRGGLQIESRLGEGSTFTVYLPVAEAQPREPAADPGR